MHPLGSYHSYHKAGKKDKTSPKAWHPVENYKQILAKPLERLIGDRMSFDAESLGFLGDVQHGGRPGHSTLQAVDGYIHRVNKQLDKGNTVLTLFYDLKGAFNRISHRVVIQEMAAMGYPRFLICWVALFLHHHCVTVVIDGVPTATFRCEIEGAPQGSALSVILFLLYINRLLRLLKAINVSISWCYGFVNDTNFSTASKLPSQNITVLNKAVAIAFDWEKVDSATFENPKSEVLHHSPGRADLSSYSVTFEGITISPSDMVKWVAAASAVRTLNAALALKHPVWGLKPLMIRDLASTMILPRADYSVSSFFSLPAKALRSLERINKAMARCITGGYRTASLAALEKEAALLPAPLCLERYLCMPSFHSITPLIQETVLTVFKHAHRASALHFVERLPAIHWPSSVPTSGKHIRNSEYGLSTDVTTDTSAGPEGSGARGKRGGSVTDYNALCWSPPSRDRQVSVSAPPVTSVVLPQCPTAPDLTLGLEPILPVYSPPWANPLPVNTVIPTKTSGLAVLKEFLANQRYEGSAWYTDGSLIKGRAGEAAVLVVQGKVAEGEVEGILGTTERAIALGVDQILIVSDSQAGLRAILLTSPRSGQFRAIRCDQLVRKAQQSSPALRITNLWTPARIGTEGNELADDAAKAATMLPPPPAVPVSLRHAGVL
ncbi:reverse transcriptase [Mycena venus]|uniref:Reverse transcriptase n=1 Tax=Mycena venus TaxID=2733690 RepID=A0A8H6Z4E6_9AGAR|nr:reverse transcriptase [Mycena venus]